MIYNELIFQMAVWDSFAAENKTMVMEQIVKNKRFSDALLILWAGGAALLSCSLVYALRKPYTAASFEGFDFSARITRSR